MLEFRSLPRSIYHGSSDRIVPDVCAESKAYAQVPWPFHLFDHIHVVGGGVPVVWGRFGRKLQGWRIEQIWDSSSRETVLDYRGRCAMVGNAHLLAKILGHLVHPIPYLHEHRPDHWILLRG